MPYKNPEDKANWQRKHRVKTRKSYRRPTVDELRLRRDFYLSNVYVMPQYSDKPTEDPGLNQVRPSFKQIVKLGCDAYTNLGRPGNFDARPNDDPNFIQEWIAARQIEVGVPFEEACLDSVEAVELIERIVEN